MQLENIDNFTKGWLIGDFSPSLFNSKDIEIAVKYYKSGDIEQSHVHKIVTEYTAILTGIVIMNGTVYHPKEIIKINPNESTDFECLQDAITLVIKTPSITSDKYLCNE